MKIFYLFISIITLFLTSCRVDEFSPCDVQEGMEDLLCKEFRFEHNSSIGYLVYYYNEQEQLSRMEYKSTDGELKKYDTFEYDDNKLSKETAYDAKGNLIREKLYTYNSTENLSNVYHIENGVEVFYKAYEYSDTLLKKESTFNHNELENYTLYQYYNGETNLYRKSFYAANGELMNYTNIEYFVNNFERHNHYTGNHVSTGYDVYTYDENQNITRFSSYNASGKLVSYIDYNYNAKGQLDTSEEYDEDGKKIKNNKFIYHN